MSQLVVRVGSFLRDEEGATMVEYGLMIALIALIAVAAVTALGGGVTSTLGSATAGL